MKSIQPIRVDFSTTPGELILEWSDRSLTRHSLAQLRKACPCAGCRAERDKMQTGSKGLISLRVIKSDAPAVAEARLEEVSPVGRYALCFTWNDGHKTGIYSYDFLLEHKLPDQK